MTSADLPIDPEAFSSSATKQTWYIVFSCRDDPEAVMSKHPCIPHGLVVIVFLLLASAFYSGGART